MRHQRREPRRPRQPRTCQTCGVEIVAGYQCERCWFARKAAMNGALDSHAGQAPTLPPLPHVAAFRCDHCGQPAEQASIADTLDGAYCFCEDCAATCGVWASRAWALGAARGTDWPGRTDASHIDLMTTDAGRGETAGWDKEVRLIVDGWRVRFGPGGEAWEWPGGGADSDSDSDDETGRAHPAA